jgi:CubicO group peptidase (beta-lactamase class C family)
MLKSRALFQICLSFALVGLIAILKAGAATQPLPAGTIVDSSAARKNGSTRLVQVSTPALDRSDVEPWLDGFMSLALARTDIAGATVAIVKDGQVVLTKGYGYADVAHRVSVNADRHLFRIASITKLFTWTAVMQQVEQGNIDLDADINRYLDFRVPPYKGKPLTMRHLMTQSAGFELVIGDLISAHPVQEDLGGMLKRWIPDRIYLPGTTPTYSNYGAGLAGYIVERVSGEKFDSYVENHILHPLGMTRSTTRQPPPTALSKDLSKGYVVASGQPSPYEYLAYSPAGAMSSTAGDMARFMIAHLNDGALGPNRILRSETAELMHRSRRALLPPLHGMALGFYRHDINGRRVLVHDGDTSVFHSQLNLFIDDGTGIFVSVNSTGRDRGADILRAALFTEFADRYFPFAQADGSVDPSTAARHARAMVGHYQISDRSASNFLAVNSFRHQTAVEVDGDGNLVVPDLTGVDGAPKRWREIAPFVWREVNGKERLAAQLAAGRPVRFSHDEYSPLVVYDRLPWWRSTVWLEPLAYGAYAILLLIILCWPVVRAAQSSSGSASLVVDADRRVYYGLILAAIIGLSVPKVWLGIIEPVTSFTADRKTIGTQIVAASALTLIGYVGGLLLAVGNAWLAWRHRDWTSRLWSLVVLLSFGVLSWVAWLYNLLSFSTGF